MHYDWEDFLPKILPAATLSSHSSYYSFLASHPEAAVGGCTPWINETDSDGTSVFWNPSITDSQGNELNLMDPSVWAQHKLGALWHSTAESDYDAVKQHIS